MAPEMQETGDRAPDRRRRRFAQRRNDAARPLRRNLLFSAGMIRRRDRRARATAIHPGESSTIEGHAAGVVASWRGGPLSASPKRLALSSLARLHSWNSPDFPDTGALSLKASRKDGVQHAEVPPTVPGGVPP